MSVLGQINGIYFYIYLLVNVDSSNAFVGSFFKLQNSAESARKPKDTYRMGNNSLLFT